jgi:hypothetical protein
MQEDNIKTDLQEAGRGCSVGYWKDKPLGSIKDKEFTDHLSEHQFLKNCSKNIDVQFTEHI